MPNFDIIRKSQQQDHQQEITNQEKHHLAMWLTTILDSPCISKIIKNIHEKEQFEKQPKYVNIVSFNRYLIAKQNITQQVRMFILSNILDAGLLKQNFYQENSRISKNEAKFQRKLFKELRKQLEVQFHRQKLIFSRKLINIHPFTLFGALDKKKIGHITFKQVFNYIQTHISDVSIFRGKSLDELKDAFSFKFTQNIHDSSNLNQNVKVKGQSKVNMQNFTELIQRINCHPQFEDQIGTYKFLNAHIRNLQEYQIKKLMIEDYQRLQQMAKYRDQSLCHTELKQINLLAKHIVRTNQEFQPSEAFQTEQKGNNQLNQNCKEQEMFTPVKNKKNIVKNHNLKSLAKLKTNKSITPLRKLSKTNQKISKSPYKKKSAVSVQKLLAYPEVKKIQKSILSKNKQPVSTAVHAYQQSEQKKKNENYPISTNINSNIDQYRTPTNQKQNYDKQFNRPQPFFVQREDKSILVRSQVQNKNIEQIQQRSRKQRERSNNLNQELDKRRNIHNFSMSEQFRFCLDNKNNQNSPKQNANINKLSTIKKQKTNQKQSIEKNFRLYENSLNNKPTHRVQPTFGFEETVLEGSETFQDKLNDLHLLRKEALLKQLQQIKMERIRNRMHMYMFC